MTVWLQRLFGAGLERSGWRWLVSAGFGGTAAFALSREYADKFTAFAQLTVDVQLRLVRV